MQCTAIADAVVSLRRPPISTSRIGWRLGIGQRMLPIHGLVCSSHLCLGSLMQTVNCEMRRSEVTGAIESAQLWKLAESVGRGGRRVGGGTLECIGEALSVVQLVWHFLMTKVSVTCLTHFYASNRVEEGSLTIGCYYQRACIDNRAALSQMLLSVNGALLLQVNVKYGLTCQGCQNTPHCQGRWQHHIVMRQSTTVAMGIYNQDSQTKRRGRSSRQGGEVAAHVGGENDNSIGGGGRVLSFARGGIRG